MNIRFWGMILLVTASVTYATWERVAMPPVYFGISKMEFANENYGCALGNDDNDPYNFLVYGNGAWGLTQLPGMYIGTARDVSFLPSGYGWVAGRYMGMNRALYTARRQPGVGWVFIHNPYENGPMPAQATLMAIGVAAEEDVWLLFRSPNYLLHYKDGVWEDFPNVLPTQIGYALDIYFVNPNDGWVSGTGGFAHYVGGSWQYVAGPSVAGLDFTAADDGWATDYDGPNVYHYNGSSWSRVINVSGYKAFKVSFSDRNNGWADFYLSEGHPVHRIYKYENSMWREVTSPEPDGVWEPCSVTPNACWFLGKTGKDNPSYTSWRWYTGVNFESSSLGRIKASFR